METLREFSTSNIKHMVQVNFPELFCEKLYDKNFSRFSVT